MLKSFLKLCLAAGAAGSLFLLAACNTVEGAGEDVAAVGEGVSGASRDIRD